MYDNRHSYSGLTRLAADATHGQPYQEVEMAGPAVAPLDFPTPIIGIVEHQNNVSVVDHITGWRLDAKHILVPQPPPQQPRRRGLSSPRCNAVVAASTAVNHAYLTRKRLAKSPNGHQVRLCMVLRRRVTPRVTSGCTYQSKELQLWETTDELVVIKSCLRVPCKIGTRCNASSLVQPQDLRHAVAAQQYVGNYHPRCLGAREAFQDDDFLYLVLPYCPGRNLYSKLLGEVLPSTEPATAGETMDSIETSSTSASEDSSYSAASLKSSCHPLEEHQARFWFCQILQGIAHLQKKGVCHGGLSLENILLDDTGSLVLSDFRSALRIPYDDDRNVGGSGITDNSEGRIRRLMCYRVPLVSVAIRHSLSATQGNPMFMAPELVKIASGSSSPSGSAGSAGKNAAATAEANQCVFDGFAVDLWSVGVILYIMLTGSAPFSVAHESDARFVQICLRGLLHKMPLPTRGNLSPSATHLLQNMLWANPAKRLTLAEILVHPWVCPRTDEAVIRHERILPLKESPYQDNRQFPANKKQLHYLSFYHHFHSFGGNDAIAKVDSTVQQLTVPRGKTVQASERMASF